MIVREQTSIFKLLFSWKGTILPKVLPPLGFVVLLSTIIGGLSYIGFFNFPELPLVGFTLIAYAHLRHTDRPALWSGGSAHRCC